MNNRSEETADRIAAILKDAITLNGLCGDGYEGSGNYQQLLRMLKEQNVENEDGTLRLRTKEDGGMDASILQPPAEPDATYREKAGKQNRGYVTNVTEAAGKNGSIVTDYQYEQNTHSNSQFMKDCLEKEEKHAEPVTVVADGTYSGSANEELASEKNVELVTTNLTGRRAGDTAVGFGFNEEATKIEKCVGGFEPKNCSYNPQTG